MATSVQTVWDRANAMSVLNSEALISSAQVMDYIGLYERNIFLRAARLNPEYFGVTASTTVRQNFTDAWDLTAAPGQVAAVTRAEVLAFTGTPYTNGPNGQTTIGDQVNLISVRWPFLDVAPRAMLRGRRVVPYPFPYTGAQPELGINNQNMVTQLNIFFSPLPAPIVALNQFLTVPDEWADLITYPLAKILAIRDRRVDEEVAMLDEQYLVLSQLFDEAVLVYDFGARRPLNQVPVLPTQIPGGAGEPQGRARQGKVPQQIL